MESLITNQWVMIIGAITGVAGVAVCWFGVLVAMLVAFGNKRWGWGILIFMFGPFFGIPFAFVYDKAEYARSLMIKGVLISIPALVLLSIMLFQQQ